MKGTKSERKSVAILGGGPSGLFLYKRLIESGTKKLDISIFESKQQLGSGLPYSTQGANLEHITNVSSKEIPEIVTAIGEWIKVAPASLLERFELTIENFNENKVLPRLFFGAYLTAQFELLKEMAGQLGIITNLHLGSVVTDINDDPNNQKVVVTSTSLGVQKFDAVVICTGHHWPIEHEGSIPGYYDSPYPPAKLALKLNHAVGIKGSSLTAIDVIRTLSRYNGTFSKDNEGTYSYQLAKGSEHFKLVMHSRGGLLPAVRTHLTDSHLQNNSLLTKAELDEHKAKNDGFLSLDYFFEKDFKETFRNKDPKFYDRIKDMDLEAFVASMMELREKLPPFQLLKAEYKEAEKSIRRQESIYWKEALAILSFAMNYPAKYLSAEDMMRLQEVLMPLISIVIAFIPQSSCRELMALHEAGVLDIVAIGADGQEKPATVGATFHYTDEKGEEKAEHFQTFVNCVGQPHLSYEKFPFKGLRDQHTISKAKLKFASPECAIEAINQGNKQVEKTEGGDYYLNVPGLAINDDFQLIDDYGAYNNRIYMMAVPFIGGFNPDYSGLDFCAAASLKIAESLLKD